MSDETERYPIIPGSRYCQKTGRLLAHRIGQLFNELGFETSICPGQNNGVDLKVYGKDNSLYLVAEILNWSNHSSLGKQRKNRIIENLSHYECPRVLIYTAMDDETILIDLLLQGIKLLKLDYQLLPEAFYNFYQVRKKIECRRIDNDEMRQYIKAKVLKIIN